MHKINELLNTATASFGMLLSCIGFFFLVILSNTYGDYWKLLGCIIYGTTLVLLHTASTLHHGVALYTEIKKNFLIIDLSCIYLLIAGTYTPIILVCLYNFLGITMLAIVWVLAIVGIIITINNLKPFENFDLFLYLFMGWFALIGIKELISVMNVNGIILIFLGGLFFTIGTFFFKAEKLSI